MVASAKVDWGQIFSEVTKVRYLGHIIRDDLRDDDDVQHPCGKLYAAANVLVCKFHMCTDDVFRAHTHTVQINYMKVDGWHIMMHSGSWLLCSEITFDKCKLNVIRMFSFMLCLQILYRNLHVG